jgi:hypothetical protein
VLINGSATTQELTCRFRTASTSFSYTDTPFAFEEHIESLSRYADALRAAALEALAEEAMLAVLHGSVVGLQVCGSSATAAEFWR